MRRFSILVLLGFLAAGCTPDIPYVPEFGVAALKATEPIPPEYAAFNRYDPRVDALLAEQMCTTPYLVEVVKSIDAVPGEIESMQAYCRNYQPWFAALLGTKPTQ
jgi:hypothetical protein